MVYLVKQKKYPFVSYFTWLLIFLVSFLSANTSAETHPPSTDTIIDLRQEPIQPLTQPTGLDPLVVNLGKRLFNDKRLSKGNKISCSSCHFLDKNGANQTAYATGRDGAKLTINTLTVFNSGFNHHLFWDGRAQSLEDQINFVVNNKKEFATTWPDIVHKLKNDKQYLHSFKQLYDDGITADNIRNAIATFERSLVTINSRFDRYLLGDNNAINSHEKAGYRLFKIYGCIACHQGRNVGGNLFMKFGVFKDYFASKQQTETADLGRFNVTGKTSDKHVFRVPSLRLAALTAPYFHDGSAKTLEKAISVMAAHQLGREIPEQNIALIAAFIKTLPGEYNGKLLAPKSEQRP
ncbi:MAG TPA: c-type cytochrome [Gammaproteobacteria bacterium]|nr:c-type cytochrome [Gammaproteobacteria bacterium]